MKPVEIVKEVEVIREVERARPPTTDACVGTDPIEFPKSNGVGSKPTQQQNGHGPSKQDKGAPKVNGQSQQKDQRPAPPMEEEEDASSDMLSVLLGMVFSFVFGLVWLILVRIPYKIFTYTFFMVTAGAILSIVWLYLADDHGAQSMGAGLGYGYNQPGIL